MAPSDGDGATRTTTPTRSWTRQNAAAKAVGIDKTATADGGTSGDAPAWCYVTKDGDLFNEDKNTGECGGQHVHLLEEAAGDGTSTPTSRRRSQIAEIPRTPAVSRSRYR